MIRTRYIYYGILIALTAVLLGSLSHLSYTFGTLEKDGSGIISFVLATGIELGMLAIALGVAERRRQKRRIYDLLFYLLVFSFINFFGNVYHSLSIYLSKENLVFADIFKVDKMVLITTLILSGALPALVLSLTELQSIFYQKMRKEMDAAEKKKNKASVESSPEPKAATVDTPPARVARTSPSSDGPPRRAAVLKDDK